MSETVIINLYGSAGSGKSTGASFIFSILKQFGMNVEYVGEYVKEKVWENNASVLAADNQYYLASKQCYHFRRLLGAVDYIITDGALLNSNVYTTDPVLQKNFVPAIRDMYKSMNNMDFLVKRVKEYNPAGRNQKTPEEADKFIPLILKELELVESDYVEVNGDAEGYITIVQRILEDAVKRGVISRRKLQRTFTEMQSSMSAGFVSLEKFISDTEN